MKFSEEDIQRLEQFIADTFRLEGDGSPMDAIMAILERVLSLDRIERIQTSEGNWNYDPYMHGMANGLILARATILGETPKYLDAPERWLRDTVPTTDVNRRPDFTERVIYDGGNEEPLRE